MRILYIACLIAVPLLAGCTGTSRTNSPVSTESAEQSNGLEEVKLQILDWEGLQHLLASHRGKVVVLDCWSTSCEPCIREFPNLVALQKKFGRERLACISLSFDYEGLGKPEEQREPVLAFLRQQKADFDNVLSSVESDVLTAKLEIPSIPAVFVYDQTGELHRRFDNRFASTTGGPFTYEQVSAEVEELLSSPRTPGRE
jgi:thiol-disulfide isomerase/thioredoxin